MSEKKEPIIIDIPQELVDYVQSLQYECSARQSLLSLMIRQGMRGTKEYQEYHDEYVEFNAKYELAKAEVEKDHIRPKYPNCDWTLDFETAQATVTPHK